MIKFLAKQKFRFDLGTAFLSVVNFAFVVIAASDKLALLVDVPVKLMVLVLVPVAVGGAWLLGLLLDKMQFQNAYQDELNHRNEMLKEAAAK